MARRFKTADLEAGVVWTADYRPKVSPFPKSTRSSSTHKTPVQSPTATASPDISRHRAVNRGFNHSMDSAPTSTRHIPSPIPFHKQTPRPDISKMSPGVNENRFNMIKDSSPIYSKTRRVCTPNIAKAIPRHSSLAKPRQKDPPSYCPNYDIVWKKLTKTLKFEKDLGRTDFGEVPLDLVYDNINYKQVTPKVPSPDFKHTRQDTGPCELPVFMRGLTSWQAMHTLNEKMLRMNRFYPESSDMAFRSTLSSRFGTTHYRASSVGH